jgi:manganese/zinc/iron transport system permease protein
MITPPSTAYLLTQRVSDMLFLSVIFAILSAILGYIFASYADVSIAGSIASMTGVFFVGVLVLKKVKNNINCFFRARPEPVEGYPRALEDILQQVQNERKELSEKRFFDE